jgi:hypothetical protein
VRWATLVLLTLVACNDLRAFRGTWSGPRVGDVELLRHNVNSASASLSIDDISSHGLTARLTVEGLFREATITSLEGAEADVLAGITFSGAPLRVYLAFVPVPDGGGDALVVVALYEDRRVDVRLLRGGTAPLYGIFAMTEVAASALREDSADGASKAAR